MTRPPPVARRTIAGRYEVEGKLGQGGMAEVFRARHLALDAPVAIKLLRRASDDAGRARFLTEARLTAQLRTRYAVQVFDFGFADDGHPFLVMELLEGETLGARIARVGALPRATTARFVGQVARALDRAHALGIVHRDLKPDNLFVVRDEDGRELVKVMDFGIAKLLGTLDSADADESRSSRSSRSSVARTATGARLGTPRYMAPEQIDAPDAVGPAADVWAFGVLVFVCLTGRHPFDGPDTESVFEAILRGRPAPVRTLDRSLPDELDAWFATACAREPKARFTTPGEAVRALCRALDLLVEGEADALESEASPLAGPWPPPPMLAAATANETLGALPVGHTVTDPPRPRWRWSASAAIVLSSVGLAVVTIVGAVAGVVVSHRTRATVPSASAPLSAAPALVAPRVRRVTVNPRQDHVHQSAISPEGNRIAYSDAVGLHLRTLDPPSERDLPLSSGEQARFLYWFPDGRSVLVAVGLELDEVDVVTGARSRFATGAPPNVPSISPDGTRIAISTPGKMLLASRDGHVVRELFPLAESVYSMSWSPGGRTLLYAEETSPPTLATFDTQTGEKHVLLRDDHLTQETGICASIWMPDGRVVYSSALWLPAEPGSNLYAVPVDESGLPTGPSMRLTDWTGMVATELVASGSGRLSFQRQQMQADVYLGTLVEGGRGLKGAHRLTMSDRNERSGSFTRDGRSVTFMSDRFGRYDLFERDLPAGAERMILDDPSAWSTWPIVAPDGALLFWHTALRSDAGPVATELWRRDEGGATRPLRTSPEPAVAGLLGRPPPSSRVRCADHRCLVSHPEGDTLVLAELDPAEGIGGELLRTKVPTLSGWDVSRDGSRVAFPLRDGTIELWELQPTPRARHVSTGMYVEYLAWLPSGDALVATGFDSSRAVNTMARVDLDGHVTIYRTDPAAWMSHPEVSPGGDMLAYTQKTYDDDTWIVDGL